MKMRSTDPRATVVTYAFFHAFKFPDSMAVHIRCKVEICRYGCPDHCQSPAAYGAQSREQVVSSNVNSYQAAAPPPPPPPQQPSYTQNRRVFPPAFQTDPRTPNNAGGGIYAPRAPQLPVPSALVNEKPRIAKKNGELDDSEEDVGSAKTADAGLENFLGLKLPTLPSLPSLPSIFGGSKKEPIRGPQAKKDGEAIPLNLGIKPQERKTSSVPVHRNLNEGQPLVFPSSFNTAGTHVKPIEPLYASSYDGLAIPYGPRALHVGVDGKPVEQAQKKRKREAEILSRTERSADIGVQSGYDVISEVDLDFTPDEVERKVAILQGKIKEDIIYGICMPATGFSALFVLLALMTVVSVIVSCFICYHRQLAKVAEEAAPEPATARVATLPHGVVPIPLNQVTMKQTLIQHTMKV